MKVCGVVGCDNKHYRRDLCARHHRMQGLNSWHGSERMRTYHVWYSMVRRCTNERGQHYEIYGLRGITVDEAWLKFDNFVRDMGYKPEGKSIERIDNDRGYSKENCRWATMKEQAQNRRNSRFITVDNRRLTLAQWVDITRWPSLRSYFFKNGEVLTVEKIRELTNS